MPKEIAWSHKICPGDQHSSLLQQSGDTHRKHSFLMQPSELPNQDPREEIEKLWQALKVTGTEISSFQHYLGIEDWIVVL